MFRGLRTTTVQYVAAASLLAVFIINIMTPPAVIIDILYLSSIVLVYKQNSTTILCFSVAAAVLIIINALFFERTATYSMSVWINRGISLFAIGVTSYTAIHYHKQTEAGITKNSQYLTALEAMLFITSHQVRKPVANILGLVETMQASGDLSPSELQQLCLHFQFSARELDAFIKVLNAFIERTETEHNKLPPPVIT
jgi:hypothetical protein